MTKKNEKNANLGAFKENVDKNRTNDRATQNIAVKGYASPDGPVKFNDKLSQARSESGKKVVAKTAERRTVWISTPPPTAKTGTASRSWSRSRTSRTRTSFSRC